SPFMYFFLTFLMKVTQGTAHVDCLVGPLALLACMALIPLLVVGTWSVVMTLALGLSDDGILWVLDQRWRTSSA
ncbi:MAG: hypothetical protein ABI618_13350, partial [Nitrospirota bacterium]